MAVRNAIKLTMATSHYDHFADLTGGLVPVQGVDLTCLSMPVEEIFHRFTSYREWDISEMSFAKFSAVTARDDCDITAIPVFPSRVFRQSSIFVRADSSLREAERLVGRKVGIPEWAQTAAVYTRGWLMHDLNIELADIEWYQAGVNAPGRREKVALRLPPGVTCTPVPEKSLTEMLIGGELDAVFSAHPPLPFEQRSGEIRQLFDDPKSVEREYYLRTGIFPIMHVIAIRKEVLDRHPWVAMNLMKAFMEARARSLLRARELTASRFPIAWGQDSFSETCELFGTSPFPYGVEANRNTLEAFLLFCREQGVCERQLTPEELFPAEVRTHYVV